MQAVSSWPGRATRLLQTSFPPPLVVSLRLGLGTLVVHVPHQVWEVSQPKPFLTSLFFEIGSHCVILAGLEFFT